MFGGKDSQLEGMCEQVAERVRVSQISSKFRQVHSNSVEIVGQRINIANKKPFQIHGVPKNNPTDEKLRGGAADSGGQCQVLGALRRRASTTPVPR